MKSILIISGLMLTSALLLTANINKEVFLGSSKQEKEVALKTAIEAPNYTFVANIAIPMRGSARNLTSTYDLRVTNDTIVAYLPFFGRAYTAPISPEEAGIMFTSTKFTYTKKITKHEGWEITIKTKDTKVKYELFLSISKNGYGTLTVQSVNRESISFSGTIRQP
ncbi:DUF4251 domain-containing protein [uncultured Acetobacteroides sp.]|uniref:DUF4251 domain-containing protein n=1 Tax=uncultured Acetobacteroides sp. TaxID=1760811 RepID=UPI0029F4D66A|nr:DUF4251 domain-containing protein [uncultured Acetobacteroides sp.]